MWTDSPPPLAAITEDITAARKGDPASATTAIWLLLTLIPRGGLHLLSWLLAHPARTVLALLTAAVTWLLA